LFEIWDEDNSKGAGYLAAAFDGEGSFAQAPRQNSDGIYMNLSFSQKENEMSAKVDAELEERGFRFYKNKQTDCQRYNLNGGRPGMLKFLGQIRPPRLLAKFAPNKIGVVNSLDNVKVVKKEFIGDQEVIGFKTGTQTIIVDGFASHNSQQRPSCEYFIGIARGMGIKVHVPDKSDLLKTLWLYPFEPESPMWVKCESRRRELQQRANEIHANEMAMRDNRNQVIGAIENMNYVQKAWGNTRRDAGLIKG